MKTAPIALIVLLAAGLVFSPLVASLASSGVTPSVLHLGPQELRSLGAHLLVALSAALTALVLGAPFAIYVAGTRSPLRTLLLALGALALAVPHYLAAETLIDLVGPAGRLTRLVAPVSEEQARLGVYRWAGFVYSAPAAGFVIGACLMPLVALAIAVADRRADPRLREAARLVRGRLGAARIAARALGAPALGAALLVFALALTEFATPQTLRVRTLGEDVFTRISEGDRAGAAAIGLVLVALALVVGAPGAFVLARRRVAGTAALEGDAPRFALRPSRPLVGTIVGLACVTPGFLAPLASLSLQVRAESFVDFSPSLAVLGRAWATAGGDATRTVLLAAVAATIALALAAPLGRALAGATRTNAALLGFLSVGLAVPSPLVGLGLILLWNRHATGWIYDGPAVVVLGWLARFLPVAALLARAAFARVPVELEHAAALMGRRAPARQRTIVLPLAAPGLVAAWLAFYACAATEFAATELVLAPGQPLLAPTVVNQVHYGQSAVIAAMGLILVGAVVAPLVPLSAILLLRRTWRSS